MSATWLKSALSGPAPFGLGPWIAALARSYGADVGSRPTAIPRAAINGCGASLGHPQGGLDPPMDRRPANGWPSQGAALPWGMGVFLRASISTGKRVVQPRAASRN